MKETFSKRQLNANALRRHRKVRGLSQREVARILGLKSPSMISRWETGVCIPDSLNLLRLAVLYRTMVEALFGDHLQLVRAELSEKESEWASSTPETTSPD